MNENAEFCLAAGRLVDVLKRPENADILEQFAKYNAREEGGWYAFDLVLSPDDVKFYQSKGWPVPMSVLTPEQVTRWNAINRECEINGSGASDTVTWLVAQLLLGRTDVIDS